MTSIYKVTNLINGKVYIGKTTRRVRDRFMEHKREQGKLRISKYNAEHKEQVISGMMAYNQSRKFPVAMLDEGGNILRTFDCLLDACKFLGKPECGTSSIKKTCDKFNKNGKRARFYGYSWMALNKGVQTNP